MKITDGPIVRHIIMNGHIKRSFWADAYVSLAQDASLQMTVADGRPHPYIMSVSALAASDWEMVK